MTGNGFSAFQQTGIQLSVGQDLLVNATLQVGNLNEQVEVSAAAAQVQTEETSVSQLIDHRRIMDLPLNGRQATQLILLSGAATTAPAGDMATSKNYPSAVTISVGGGQANGINYLLDGGDNNDAFSNVNLPFPFPDALQEFSVQTTGLAARYGLHPGAVVSLVTRSGANQFHGDLFEFLRNGDLNARNFFAAAQDTLRRNQFGGTVGGPILRNKLFFFGGYQGTITRTTPPNTTSFVPTSSVLNGDFSSLESAACQSSRQARQLVDPSTRQPLAGNYISPSLFNPQAVALLKYVPVATNPCGQIIYGVPNPSREDQYLGRVDWNQNDKHSMFVRYFGAKYSNPLLFNGNLLTLSRPALADLSQSLNIGDNFSFTPTLLNAFHATGTRLAIHRGAPSDTINPTTVGIPISVAVPNFIDVIVGNDFTLGCGTCIPSVFVNNSVQLSDDLDWVRGKHHLSLGVDWIHNQLNTVGASNENGVFTFNGQSTGDEMADFLLGRLSNFTQGNPTGGNFRQNYIGIYGQDDVHVSSTLNVHLGLRWEPFLPEVDIYNRGLNFSPTNYAAGVRSTVYVNAPPGLLFYGDAGVPNGYVNRRLNLFEPRVGFAWNPGGNGKQSVRASYSMGYDTPEIFYEARFETNAPFGSSVTIPSPSGGLSNPYAGYPGGNPFPLPFPPSKTQTFPNGGAYVALPRNLQPTYMQQWDFSYQTQLSANWLLSVTYLGNKTTHLWANQELNPAVYIPGASSTGNTNQRRVLYLRNPTFGALYSTLAQTDSGANANYNGMVLSTQHRFAHGYTLLANYTYSHCLSSTNFAGDIAGPSYQNPSNRNADYGNCAFDLRHNFNLSIVATVPDLQSVWARRLLSGWELAPILSVHSGSPINPVTGTDRSLTGVGLDRPDAVGDPYVENLSTRQWITPRAFTPNALGTFGNAGSYSLVGPGYFDVDVALIRLFTIRERLKLEARGEFFNALNHTNFANPTATLSSSSFGTLLSANDPRILQFAMKLVF